MASNDSHKPMKKRLFLSLAVIRKRRFSAIAIREQLSDPVGKTAISERLDARFAFATI